jgi:hypothetical protein
MLNFTFDPVTRSGRWLPFAFWLILALIPLLLISIPLESKPVPTLYPKVLPGLALARLPLSFIPNMGQTDPAVYFQARSRRGSFFFSPAEVVLALSGEQEVRFRFVGANPTLEIVPAELLPGKVNYFIGDDPALWQSQVPTYAGVIYRQLYPGIDLLASEGLQSKRVWFIGRNPAGLSAGYSQAIIVRN